MIFRCNTTISVLSSGTTTDEWGDPLDSSSVVASGIPASVTETSNTSYSENSTRPRVIRFGTCRVSSAHTVQITQNTRIQDETTGITWIILAIQPLNNALGHSPMHIEMQRTS